MVRDIEDGPLLEGRPNDLNPDGKAKGHAGGHAHRRKASQVHPNSHHVAEVHLEERKMERVSQGPAWSFFWIFSLFFS